MADTTMELIGIKVPPEMLKQLEDLAESDRRPLSAMARILLEEALATRAKKTKKQ